ncbi:hypothetical protein DSM03_102535 [Leeuwenhoekiella aestuarii]|uniref:Uncharacterized protein n=1 Tax=Leeuwenhoekiella aestuarii TaxID=2249426 RepID=A0A4Q0NU70_9FLAO|nr:hypothetical protein DSM04_103119 [Leeuwenhoekiella aestuarii]RXG17658.1 hypothetical protein DSM03_102535 [Leeuwenhoekiella aestuarii]
MLSVGVNAQEKPAENSAGIYHQRGNSPEGGTNYILFPDQQFVIAFFGGMLKGMWQQQGDQINFKTTAVPHYSCYGRYVAGLKGTQIRFKINEPNQTLVAWNTLAGEMTPVFNKEANCFMPPYILDLDQEVKKIYLLQNSAYLPETPMYEFTNDQNFNEFLIINLKPDYTEVKEFSLTMNTLGKKHPWSSLSEEDLYYFKKYLNTIQFPTRLDPENPIYPKTESHNSDSYVQLKAENYPKPEFRIRSKPYFHFSCDDP